MAARERGIKRKIRRADTRQRWTWNRKTNVYLHCICARSVLVLFWQILRHSSTSCSFDFLFKHLETSSLPFFICEITREVHWSLLFYFHVSATFKFSIARTQTSRRFTYVKVYIVSIFSVDYDAIGQMSGTAINARAHINGSNRNWMVLSIKYIILHNLWSFAWVCAWVWSE